jgi:NDP-sugar pyrophosphorylase family protein
VVETPVVAFPLRWLARGGVTRATVCANSAARGVRAALQGRLDATQEVDFSEDWMPRGAAGCVRDAADRNLAQTFVVVDGATLPSGDLGALLEAHRQKGAALTVSVWTEPGGAADLRPNGVYIIDRSALDHVSRHGYQDIKEALIPKLHAAGAEIAFHESAARSPRILDAESYLDVNRWAISRLAGSELSAELQAQGYETRAGAFIHGSARVSDQARLVGPVVVAPGATVEDRATIVGPASVGRGSRVAQGAVVSRSVVWGDCRLERDSLVDGCLLSDGAVVPARSSRYRALEPGPLPEEALGPADSGPMTRLQGWVSTVLPGGRPAPGPRPAKGLAYPEPSTVDRAIALGRVRS